MVDKNPEKIQKMFNKIANKYDFLNNVISFGAHKFIKKITFGKLNIKKGSKILDICTGTGDIARIIKQKEPSADVTGVDFSSSMLEFANEKYEDENIKFICEDVCNLEFEDNTFDIITSGFGLRNIENFNLAVKEVKRVLKNNGVFAYLDFSCKNDLVNSIFDRTTVLFARIFGGDVQSYKYLIKSKKEFKKPHELIENFKNSGFKLVSYEKYMFDAIVFLTFKK